MMLENYFHNRAFPSTLSNRAWLALGVFLAVVPFLATLQTTINGSISFYTTDTGEIQNALPRWGTLHGVGYPQYSMTGALIVTLLRLFGVAPAAGASLVSTFWAAMAVGLLILLGHELGAPMPAAVLGSWLVALSTSIWMDASLAEMHTLTIALTFGTLWFAVRFGRSGQRRDLLWMILCFTQGVVHQRSVLLITPAVVVLIAPQWRTVMRRPFAVLGVGILAPFTYLYIWIRIRMNGDWIYERDLWKIMTDNQAERLVHMPSGMDEWWTRLERLLKLLSDDLPLPLLGIGLVGLLLLTWSRSRREALGLTLGWLPSFGLGLLIWEGRVGDSLLASKLPLLSMAGLGLGLLLGWVSIWLTGRKRDLQFKAIGSALLVTGLVVLGIHHYPRITAVTRDPSAEKTIRVVEQVTPPPDGRPATLVALWGNQYWQLSYAQRFQGRLPRLNLVWHYTRLRRWLEAQGRLWVLSESFWYRSLDYWEQRVGQRLALASIAPGILQLSASPQLEPAGMPTSGQTLDLENGICIAFAELSLRSEETLLLKIVWRAISAPTDDYSVAVDLLARDPPREGKDILSRTIRDHPVEGWYPTSRWTAGEYVTDHYEIDTAAASEPVAVRVTLYSLRTGRPPGSSPWLSVPIPPSLERSRINSIIRSPR